MKEHSNKRLLREFTERFGQALDQLGVPPKYRGRAKWVAHRYGVSTQAARKWLEVEAIPERERWEEIALSLNVRVEWLFFGLGPMREEAPSVTGMQTFHRGGELLGSILDAVEKACPHLTREERLSIASAIFAELNR